MYLTNHWVVEEKIFKLIDENQLEQAKSLLQSRNEWKNDPEFVRVSSLVDLLERIY